MFKKYRIVICFIVVLSAVGCWWRYRQDDITLHLLHTNDLHAHLIPWHAKNSDCAPNGPECRGGFAYLKTMIEQERKKNPDTILLDAGDRFSGTVFYTFRKGRDIADLIDAMNYDALGIGNHEFDDGLPELARFVKRVSAPCVAANIQFADDTLARQIQPFTVVTRNGRRIGIIGAVTEDIKTETKAFHDSDIAPVIDTVCQQAKALTAQGIDILFALTHIGIDNDKALAAACPDIDIIVGAHTHTLLSNDPTETTAAGAYPLIITHSNGTQTAIVTAGMGGHHLGKLTAVFDKHGRLKTATGDTLPIDKNIQPDTTVTTHINNVRQALADLLNTPLTTLPHALSLTPNQLFCSENCAVGEALADIALQADGNADFAMLNAGGLRAALPAGTVTIAHLAQAYPFDSALVTIELTGQEIADIIQKGITAYLPDDRTNTLMQVAGLSYTFNGNTRKVIAIQTATGALSPKQTYRVVIPSFLADGGDGFPQKTPIRFLSKSVRDALINGIQKHNPKKPENRIRKI